jgi:hypothetical protein
VQYSRVLGYYARFLLLINLDPAGTNDKHTLLAVTRQLLLSFRTPEWAEPMCPRIAMPLASGQDSVAGVGEERP